MSEQIAKQIAEKLDGSEYPLSISSDILDEARENHIVIVSGLSDDICIMGGCIYDEIDAYEGGEFYISENEPLDSQCEQGWDCPHFQETIREKIEQKNIAKIEAIWDQDGIPWQYETALPSSTFNIMEDGNIYCIGRVIYLNNMKERLS